MGRLIELCEYSPKRIPANDFDSATAELIWREHGDKITVDPPSFRTDYQWQLTAQGYVGYLPITSELTLALTPKVPLKSVFGMLEYAYQLDFKLFGGFVDCSTLEEFFERLASILAKRVLDRQRRGLHRQYVGVVERSGYIRGRLNLMDRIRRPWSVSSECAYEEHTAQIEDNEILGWALRMTAQSGLCSERVRPTVHRAYRGMNGINLVPTTAASCLGRTYNRLNADYQVLHALSRFFLDRSGPEHRAGDHSMLPFLVNMNLLFERFVSEWLRVHLPRNFSLQVQSRYALSEDESIEFIIDLVVQDVQTGETLCILDTKYKRPEKPSAADITQAVAYAEAKGCMEAILIYPTALPHPFDGRVGRIRVRSLTFSLDGDLEAAGGDFMNRLFVLRS